MEIGNGNGEMRGRMDNTSANYYCGLCSYHAYQIMVIRNNCYTTTMQISDTAPCTPATMRAKL